MVRINEEEETLDSTHRKLRAVFDAIQENMNVVDLDFNLTDVNDVLIKAFGLPDKESVLGRKCFDALKGRKNICPNCAVAEVYRTKAPAYRTSTAEDEISTGGRTFEIFAYPIIDWDGNLTGAVEFARDSTKQRQAEEALRKAHDKLEQRVKKCTAELLKANERLKREIEELKRTKDALEEKITELNCFINNIPDMAWLKDADSRFIAVNKAFGEAVGMDPESLINQTCEVCFAKKEAKKFREDDQKVMKSRRQEIIEEKIIDSQKNEVWLETIKSPILNSSGEVIGTVGIARDISTHKQAEEALRQREAALEIRTSELEEANIALRVLLKRRDADKGELEEKVSLNVKELVVPFAEKLKKSGLDAKQMAYLSILESNLNDIVSPFLYTLSSKYSGLTPTEIQTAHLVKDGKTTKEIAGLLNVSPLTIESRRKDIRRKMGIKNRKANLRSHLLSMQTRVFLTPF